jgi:virginiamycin B lyase
MSNPPYRYFFAAALASAALAASACSGGRSAPGSPGVLPAGLRSAMTNRFQGPIQPDKIMQFPGSPQLPGIIASDGAGGDWFAECETTIGRIDEAKHTFEQFTAPKTSSCFGGVALGPKHTAMWYTDQQGNHVGFIYLKSHQFHIYDIPTAKAYPAAIAAGPDNAIWFTESKPYDHLGKIGRVDLSTHPFSITEYDLPYDGGNGEPQGIALGSDGALWFTDSYANGIGRITTSHDISLYPLPHASSEPMGIAPGPDGALWFTEYAGRIGRIDPSTHAISEWHLAAPNAQPYSIVARDADLWFTEYGAGRIGCISSKTHHVRGYQLPASSEPLGITLGSDNALWFTEHATNALGRFVPPDPCAS